MSEEYEIKGVIPNYYAFIIDKLNRIAEAEIYHNYPQALHISLNLAKYLPRKLKQQIQPEKDRIENRLHKEAKVSGFFRDSMRRQASQLEIIIAKEEEPQFVDRITTLLDEAHLLTQSYGIPTRKAELKDLGEKLK